MTSYTGIPITVNPFAYKATLLATAALTAKMFVTLNIQGSTRFAAGTRPPEDAKLSVAKGSKQSYGLNVEAKDDEKLQKARLAEIRWQRIVWNDLENLPLGLIVAWGGLVSPASPRLHAALAVGFAAVR
ncbi:hypothetical protein HDU96_007986 [Phlyctochytrium bullatum]|nr:hypothetical protein HDU96_007986 [Phlyctochytrium bullatum]